MAKLEIANAIAGCTGCLSAAPSETTCKEAFHDPLVPILENGMREERQLVHAASTAKTGSNSPESGFGGSPDLVVATEVCLWIVCATLRTVLPMHVS